MGHWCVPKKEAEEIEKKYHDLKKLVLKYLSYTSSDDKITENVGRKVLRKKIKMACKYK